MTLRLYVTLRAGACVPANFQFLCRFHNISKGNQDDAIYRSLNGIAAVTPWDKASGLWRLAADLPLDSPDPGPIDKGPARRGKVHGSGQTVDYVRLRHGDDADRTFGSDAKAYVRKGFRMLPLDQSAARFLKPR